MALISPYTTSVSDLGIIGKIQHTEVLLKSTTLPKALNNFTICQLSDFHYGPLTSKDVILQAVELVSTLNPNCIVLTGDFVQLSHRFFMPIIPHRTLGNFRTALSYQKQIRQLTIELSEIFADLKASHGIFAVAGNHDHVEGLETIKRNLSSTVSWLENESVVINKDGATLKLVGVDDVSRGNPELVRALDLEPLNNHSTHPSITILLSHTPDIVVTSPREIISNNIDLILCGHTHGGQIRLPGIGAIVTHTRQRRFVQGLQQFENTLVYTSRGLGQSIIPIRLFCPPEVVTIRFAYDNLQN